ERQGGQGVAIGGIDQQSRGQLVAAVGALAEQDLIGFAGVAVVVELRPVVDEQGILGRGVFQGVTADGLERLDEGGEGSGVVGEESPGGLGAGEGGGEARQGGGPGGERGRAAEVFAYQLDVAALQPRFERRHRKVIPLLYAAALV